METTDQWLASTQQHDHFPGPVVRDHISIYIKATRARVTENFICQFLQWSFSLQAK